jgi:prepilin-type N-terminal cleavage/methylation domain-containing protein
MNKKGFTLIEVLTVVAIIGLLASIVLVGLGSFRTRGRDTRRIADLRSTQNALELYLDSIRQITHRLVRCGRGKNSKTICAKHRLV